MFRALERFFGVVTNRKLQRLVHHESDAMSIGSSQSEAAKTRPIPLRLWPNVRMKEFLDARTVSCHVDPSAAIDIVFVRAQAEPFDGVLIRMELPVNANATGIALRNATLLSDMQDESRRSTTAKAEAEKRLQRYVAFFDSTADGILVVRLEGEVLFCNPAACGSTRATRRG